MPNTCKFHGGDVDKLGLILGNGFYPYAYMDDSEKFNKTSLPETDTSCGNLNMEDITDAD